MQRAWIRGDERNPDQLRPCFWLGRGSASGRALCRRWPPCGGHVFGWGTRIARAIHGRLAAACFGRGTRIARAIHGPRPLASPSLALSAHPALRVEPDRFSPSPPAKKDGRLAAAMFLAGGLGLRGPSMARGLWPRLRSRSPRIPHSESNLIGSHPVPQPKKMAALRRPCFWLADQDCAGHPWPAAFGLASLALSAHPALRVEPHRFSPSPPAKKDGRLAAAMFLAGGLGFEPR